MTASTSFDAAVDRLFLERQRDRDLSYAEIQALREEVFYAWLKEERFDPLIAYLHDQHEHGGGRELMDDLRRALQTGRDLPRIHRLFRGLIPGRVKRFWTEWPYAQKEMAGNIKNAALEKAEALYVMYEYFNCLHQLGAADAAARVKADMVLLHHNQKKALPKPDGREMSSELFWSLIATARAEAGSASEFAAALTEALRAFKGKAIKQFEEELQASLAQLWSWDLWAAAYLARGGCSDDCFDYFRAWIVAQGESAFQAALQGPERLLEQVEPVWDLQCEELLHAAEEAHFDRESKPLPAIKRPPITERGVRWKEEELEERYPVLWTRFAGS